MHAKRALKRRGNTISFIPNEEEKSQKTITVNTMPVQKIYSKIFAEGVLLRTQRLIIIKRIKKIGNENIKLKANPIKIYSFKSLMLKPLKYKVTANVFMTTAIIHILKATHN
ncbi:MAG TPA: hypothetical protein VIH86_01565 [Puia sp.]|jgi:hypothetical protein